MVRRKKTLYVREKSGNFISRMFFLDEDDAFVENITVSNDWESLEAAAISDICIYFSGSEKILSYFYLFS